MDLSNLHPVMAAAIAPHVRPHWSDSQTLSSRDLVRLGNYEDAAAQAAEYVDPATNADYIEVVYDSLIADELVRELLSGDVQRIAKVAADLRRHADAWKQRESYRRAVHALTAGAPLPTERDACMDLLDRTGA